MKECNKCANYSCSRIKSGQEKMRSRHPLSIEKMGLSCPSYAPLTTFKVTIFERLLLKQSADLVRLLKSIDLRFVEVKQAPFFTLV